MTVAVKLICLVLLIAPSSFAKPDDAAVPPGSAGYHGITQAGAAAPPPGLRSATTYNAAEGALSLQDPANVQHMSIHDDGQYSFSYSAAHSSRQERRHPDGSVQGSYSYVNPDGKLVQIDYTADALHGFNAYGEGVPPRQVAPSLYVPQDTPEVAIAKAQFLDYYQREYQARKLLEAKENATAKPETNGEAQAPAEVAVANTEEVASADSSDDDTVVISIGGAENDGGDRVGNRPVGFQGPVGGARPVGFQAPVRPTGFSGLGQGNGAAGFVSKVEPSGQQGGYMLEYVVGNAPAYVNPVMQQGYANGVQQAMVRDRQQQQVFQATRTPGHQQVMMGLGGQQHQVMPGHGGQQAQVKTAPHYPAYFFYVGQGGLPYYVTSEPANTKLPVSLRAAQVGASPVAAVHDSQVPNYGSNQQLKSSPPLYVEVGADYTDAGKAPSNSIQQFASGQAQGQSVPTNQMTGALPLGPGKAGVYPPHFPFFGLPIYVYQ